MTSNNRNERLVQLRRSANSTLRAFNTGNSFVSARASDLGEGTASSTQAQGFPLLAPQSAGGPSSGEFTVNVNLMGGTVFLDDERRVRALAKEIKRLIVEDRRRGLGVGG